MGLDREYLLQLVLSWYARAGTWSPLPGRPPHVRSPRSAAEEDRGRNARAALRDRSIGGMLRAACDAWDVHLTDLGRRAGLAGARIGEIVSGDDPSPRESEALRRELDRALEARDV